MYKTSKKLLLREELCEEMVYYRPRYFQTTTATHNNQMIQSSRAPQE